MKNTSIVSSYDLISAVTWSTCSVVMVPNTYIARQPAHVTYDQRVVCL